MRFKIFLSLALLFSIGTTPLTAWNVTCPQGCAGTSDPEIKILNQKIFDSLVAMEFLEPKSYQTWINSSQLEEHFDYDTSTWCSSGSEFIIGHITPGMEEFDRGSWVAYTPVKKEFILFNRRTKTEEMDTKALEASCDLSYARLHIWNRDPDRVVFEEECWYYEEDEDCEDGEDGEGYYVEQEDIETRPAIFRTENYLKTQELLHQVEDDIEHIFAHGYTSIFERDNTLRKYNIRLPAFENLQATTLLTYERCLNRCINDHGWKGSYYARGVHNFLLGQNVEALEDIYSLMSELKKDSEEPSFPSDVYLKQGLIEMEVGLYHEAVTSLSHVITKDPSNKEGYFQRAVAYFELGDFDHSLEDYIASEMKPQSTANNSLEFTSFSTGIREGILNGSAQGIVDFFPSLLSTANEISYGLWALAKKPISVSKEFISASQACVNFIFTHTPVDSLSLLVPELKELREDWDHLESQARGDRIGFIIGKYGIEIFAGAGLAKGAKAYRDLKKANNLLTFEAMAISKGNRVALIAQAKARATTRKKIIKSSDLSIHPGQQGKHLEGHSNYRDALARKKNPSVFIHPNPQELVNKYAGTGFRECGIAGESGYKEVVNFHEFIGYTVSLETGEKISTTWGKIHYAKNGVHIVPTISRNLP